MLSAQMVADQEHCLALSEPEQIFHNDLKTAGTF